MVAWIEPQPLKGAAWDGLPAHPLVAEILRRRFGDSEKAPDLLDPDRVPSGDLPGIGEAVEALDKARRVCVWGDFDVDGQSSTALLVAALREVGMDAFYYVPDRNSEGHGLNRAGLDQVRGRGADLVLTCDCGVGDTPELEAAARMGLDVVVTDHHVPPAELPPAAAIVHPALAPAGSPYADLCGVGVAYALVEALFAHRGIGGREKGWLDYVALGTIADLAPLRGANHGWVRQGLQDLLYRPRMGVEALLKGMGFAPPELPETEVVSFGLAPRLNAAGRMAHARLAIELLLCDDRAEAASLAAELHDLNSERQRLCRRLEAEISRAIDENPAWADEPALFMQGEDWKPGIVGIIASRLARRLGKPVVLVSAPADGMARASVRSVPGVDVQQAIDRLQDRIVRFGGHSMAAGFSIRTAELPGFKRLFLDSIAKVKPQHAAGEVRLDTWVDGGMLDADLVRQMYLLAPFGAGNPAPVFGWRAVELVNIAPLSRHGGDSLMLATDANGNRVKAVWWGRSPADVPRERVDIAFKLRLDPHGQGERVQVEIVAVRPCQEAAPSAVKGLPFEIVDWRAREDAVDACRAQHAENAGVQVWGEGDCPVEAARRRDQLEGGTDLVIWHAPAAPQILGAALQRVRPSRVILVLEEFRRDTPASFLRALGTVVRGTVRRREGVTSLPDLAARLGQRESTVQAGLDYLVEAGRLDYAATDDGLRLRLLEPARRPQVPYDTLGHLLQETAAYRRYLRRGDPLRLLGAACAEYPFEPS